jgi:hypothetical protein
MFRLKDTTHVDELRKCGEVSGGDDEWLRRYGRQLNRLYEPAADNPPEIEQLVTTLVDEIDR